MWTEEQSGVEGSRRQQDRTDSAYMQEDGGCSSEHGSFRARFFFGCGHIDNRRRSIYHHLFVEIETFTFSEYVIVSHSL